MLVAVSILHLKTASLHVTVRLYEKTGTEEDNNDTDCSHEDNVVF